MDTLIQDLKEASRGLWRSRGFASVAVLMLAVGIGVNAAVFTVANSALFKGFPVVRDNDRILYLTTSKNAVSYPDFQDWQDRSRSFAQMALVRGVFSTLGGNEGAPATYFTTQVTANAFTLLGVKPMLGRDFLPSDQQPGATPVVILRHDLWQSRFGQSPSIIGTTVQLNGVPTTIIGVMPPEFSFPETQSLWTPLIPTEAARVRESFYARYAFGRLAPGVSGEQAAAEMEGIGRQLADAYPNTNRDRNALVRDFRNFFIGENGSSTYQALWGAVGLVLLIACANVANLLLNRSLRRSRDISVRLALGAGRARIVRLVLLESVFLSGLAGLLGWGIAQLCVRAYAVTQVTGVTAILSYAPDAQLLGYAVAISVGSGLLVSVPTAWWSTRANINQALGAGGRAVADAGRTRRFADVLIAVEIALALIVLTAAGLMTRSVFKVYSADIGVNTSNVLTMSMFTPPEQYPESSDQRAFYRRLADRLEHMPGVESVATASVAPTERAARVPYDMTNTLAEAAQTTVARMTVSPGYFRTMQARIVSGRDFNDLDGPAAPQVGIVNLSFVNAHSPTESLVGKSIRIFQDGKPRSVTIVGVATDIVQDDRTRQVIEPLLYVPYEQRPQPNMFVFARTRVEPATLASAVSAEVYAVDPNLPVPGLMPLAERFARAYGFERNVTAVFMIFAGVALVLAIVGLYAIVAHSVRTRAREIGIRRAIGASRWQIGSLVLRHAAAPLVAGLSLGILAARALGYVLDPILVSLPASDPTTIATAALALTASAIAGCLIPARQALRIDPAIVLRQE